MGRYILPKSGDNMWSQHSQKIHQIALHRSYDTARGQKIPDLVKCEEKAILRFLGWFVWGFFSTHREICAGSVLCMELSQVLSKFILFIRLLIFISSIYIFNEIHNHNTTQNFASCTKTGLIAALPTVSYLSVSFSSKLWLFQERQLLQISRECNCSKVFKSITLDTVSQPTLTLLPISYTQHSLKLTHTYL